MFHLLQPKNQDAFLTLPKFCAGCLPPHPKPPLVWVPTFSALLNGFRKQGKKDRKERRKGGRVKEGKKGRKKRRRKERKRRKKEGEACLVSNTKALFWRCHQPVSQCQQMGVRKVTFPSWLPCCSNEKLHMHLSVQIKRDVQVSPHHLTWWVAAALSVSLVPGTSDF